MADITASNRFPSQYVRIRRRPRTSQSRDRPGRYPRGQERMQLLHTASVLRTLTYRFLQVIIKWRGKPVFIRHRTSDEIKEAEDTKWESLRDPQPDSDRVKKPEWLIMLGISPPLSLNPISETPLSTLRKTNHNHQASAPT